MSRLEQLPTQLYAFYIIILWALLTLPSLGLTPLFDYDESIYAQTAADMMRLGEWIVPTANGMQFFEKPPFTYYMMDLSFMLFGENAFAARLPSALFTLFTALILFRFGKDMLTPQFGLATALIFLSMLEVSLLGHAAILDAVLNFFIATCLLNYFRWLQSNENKHALWCAAMMGVAVSIKGPVGIVVPVLIIILDRLWAKDLRRTLKNIPWTYALLLFIITATPWYLMIWLEHGATFLYEFIMVHNIGRALHPMQGHGGAWHYYIIVFMVSVLPWLAMLPWFARRCETALADHLHDMIPLALIWCAVVFVLFSFAQTKLPHYISSMYPAVALAIALGWWRKAPDVFEVRTIQRITVFLLLPIAVAMMAFPVIFPFLSQWVHHPRALAVLAQNIQPGFSISIAGGVLLIALFYLLHSDASRTLLHRFIFLGFLLQSALLIPLGSFAGKLLQSPQQSIAHAMQQLPENMPVFSYNLNYPSISFEASRAYKIILDEKGMQTLQSQNQAYAVILRSESKNKLPWLATLQPTVNQGGFLFYVVQP